MGRLSGMALSISSSNSSAKSTLGGSFLAPEMPTTGLDAMGRPFGRGKSLLRSVRSTSPNSLFTGLNPAPPPPPAFNRLAMSNMVSLPPKSRSSRSMGAAPTEAKRERPVACCAVVALPGEGWFERVDSLERRYRGASDWLLSVRVR